MKFVSLPHSCLSAQSESLAVSLLQLEENKMKLKNIVLAEINLLKLHIAHHQRQEGLLKKLLDIKLWNEVPPKIDFLGVPSAGPASQVQELKTWREHYKVLSKIKMSHK